MSTFKTEDMNAREVDCEHGIWMELAQDRVKWPGISRVGSSGYPNTVLAN
jgi:hypothetical protein